MIAGIWKLAALSALLGGASAVAQSSQTVSVLLPEVSFRFERPGLAVPTFALFVKQDGSARYIAEETFPTAPDGATIPAQQIDRTVQLTPKTTENIFAAAHALKEFTEPCASKAKNIADTGKKTLGYSGLEFTSCTYNYSEDKRVVLLTDLFEAVAHTLDIGRKLDFDHRFDRLGLDAATASLVDEVDAGRAIELITIAPTLKSIAQDSAVMERVRSRAARLLQQSQPAT